MKALLLLLALPLACQRDLALPTPPQVQILSMQPARGYAGTQLHLTGTHLRGAGAIEVRIGDSKPFSPAPAAAGATADDRSIDLVVPDDATTGPIVVTNSAGRTSSAQPFTFLGVGHPRLNAVTRTADLRPRVDIAFITSTFVAMHDADHDFAGLVDPQRPESPDPFAPTGEPEAIAPAGMTDAVAMVDELPGTACPGAFGKVTLLRTPAPVPPACLPAPAGAKFEPHTAVRVETEPSAKHVLVVSDAFGWLVDFTPTPASVQVFPVKAAEPPRLAFAGLNNTWFLLADDDGLHKVDWTLTPPLGAAVPIAQGTSCLAVSSDDFGSTGAFCSASNVDLLDLSTWPPSSTGTLTGYGDFTQSAAFAGTSRLIVVTPSRAVTWDLRSSIPIASVPLLSGRRARFGPGGLFVIGTRGGATLVSAESGLSIAEVPLRVGASQPQFHLGFGGKRVIDVLLRNIGAVQRVGADDLLPAPVPIDIQPDAVAIAAAPGSPTLYVLHSDGELGQVTGVDEHLPLRKVVTPVGTAPRLSITPDGAALLVENNASAKGNDWHVVVVDALHFETAPLRDYSIGSSVAAPGLALADASWLALLGATSTRIFHLADALAGSSTPALTVPRGLVPENAALASGSLFSLETAPGLNFPAPQLVQIPLDGSAPPSAPQLIQAWAEVTAPGISTPLVLAVAVSGRRLWTLDCLGGRSCQVSTLEYDPQSQRLGAEEPRIIVPPGATELVPYPDQPRLLMVDGDADQLLVIE